MEKWWRIWNAMVDCVIKKCLCGNRLWVSGGEGAERETLCLGIGWLFVKDKEEALNLQSDI